tara:strand:+ start:64318 stop:64704 length:387 start_codon:yes stop_codon:yes gene_type:complete
MAVGRIENSIYAPHQVTPDRAVVPGPKSFDAPVGRAPFHRMLKSENIANPSNQIKQYRDQQRNQPCDRPCDRYESSSATSAIDDTPQLSPKLGEALPIQPEQIIKDKVQHTTTQVQLPATGRLIDVYV